MGAGASAAAMDIPEMVDIKTAKLISGSHFDEELFQSLAKNDESITKEQFLEIANKKVKSFQEKKLLTKSGSKDFEVDTNSNSYNNPIPNFPLVPESPSSRKIVFNRNHSFSERKNGNDDISMSPSISIGLPDELVALISPGSRQNKGTIQGFSRQSSISEKVTPNEKNIHIKHDSKVQNGSVRQSKVKSTPLESKQKEVNTAPRSSNDHHKRRISVDRRIISNDDENQIRKREISTSAGERQSPSLNRIPIRRNSGNDQMRSNSDGVFPSDNRSSINRNKGKTANNGGDDDVNAKNENHNRNKPSVKRDSIVSSETRQLRRPSTSGNVEGIARQSHSTTTNQNITTSTTTTTTTNRRQSNVRIDIATVPNSSNTSNYARATKASDIKNINNEKKEEKPGDVKTKRKKHKFVFEDYKAAL